MKEEGVERKLIKRPRGLGGLMGPGCLVYTSARHLEDDERRCSTQGQKTAFLPQFDYNAVRGLQFGGFASRANLKG
ncbi:hypothetical protein HY30_17240 [Hyphomonas chukchiensis]|uniref:Uncharacterized protein n=1 Tax=Hyphomonas chukchiensis TaxID=1280947 RepID=A0A062UMD1_9PROT|nr:hypothetical protein HY30_17240 [Hyphomonas chukchiensis]